MQDSKLTTSGRSSLTEIDRSSGEAAGGLTLLVEGDERTGYGVVLLYDGVPAARHCDGGEFSCVLENGDHSVECRLTDWRARSWRGDEKRILLEGRQYLDSLHVWVDVRVTYEVVNDHVVTKQVALEQHNASLLYYRMKNRLEPLRPVKSCWSFEQEDCDGGPLFEIYPAAGFRLDGGLAIGLLTDNGYQNLWTKNCRRRTLAGGMTALNRVPDSELLRVSDREERAAGSTYVELNFGELRDYRLGRSGPVKLPQRSEWIWTENGVIVPARLDKTSTYMLRMRYRTSPSCRPSIRITDRTHSNDYSFCFFDDKILASPHGWSEITRRFSLARMAPIEDTVHICIGAGGEDGVETEAPLDIENLEIIELTSVVEAYHPIKAGEPVKKTIFIFAEPATILRELRISSQVRLAEGLGFDGTVYEKVFFADRAMLIWIPEPRDFSPHIVPSLGYSPDMYARDSFWIAVAGHDKDISERVWQKWALSLDDAGCVRTIWTPYVGDLENSPNDSNMYFIIWAYVNHTRYHSEIDKRVIQKALDYCRQTFDPGKSGRYVCRTPAWMDVIWLKKGVVFAVNQGIYVNVLRCARGLGCDVSDAELDGAIEAYRGLHDQRLGYLAFADESYPMRDSMSPSSLLGEFMSFWLWNEPILSDEAVVNTLERLPVYDGCVPCLVGGDGRFFTEENKPFDEGHYWDPGVYINGGSWLLYEYLAYVAGLRHGWGKARERMEARLETEFNTYPAEPFSHEHIVLGGGTECYHKVFGWNTFIIIANRVAEASSLFTSSLVNSPPDSPTRVI